MLVGDCEPAFLLAIIRVFAFLGRRHLLLIDGVTLLEGPFGTFETLFILVLLGTVTLLLLVPI